MVMVPDAKAYLVLGFFMCNLVSPAPVRAQMRSSSLSSLTLTLYRLRLVLAIDLLCNIDLDLSKIAI